MTGAGKEYRAGTDGTVAKRKQRDIFDKNYI